MRARERKEFMRAVGLAVLAAGIKDWKLTGVEITGELIVVERRRRDSDNLMIRFAKPILDSLVRLGVLVDDSVEHVVVRSVVAVIDPVRAPKTVVEIWQGGGMTERTAA